MFISQNQLASERESLSRIVVTVAGKPASDHDVLQFQTCTLLRYGLEADLLGLSGIGQCVYRRVIHGIPAVDLYGYASDMKYVKLAYLDRLQQTQGEFPWLPFKREVAPHIQNKWILVVVANLVHSPRATLQWLSFDERMLLDTNEKDIAGEIQAYVDFERTLAALDQQPESVLQNWLSTIIGEWLEGFSLADSLPDPTFGPGAVADLSGRVSQLEKLQQMRCNWATIRSLSQYWDVAPEELLPWIVPDSENAELWMNRIIFRPKNALKHRIISAEPAWLSWLQQAIKRPLYDYVESHHRMNTWFSDQGLSREMAQRGSRDGSYATIDFSNASDAISATLVRRLFKQVPWICGPLLETRSRTALLPDGRIISLNKFAPMGSATCFVTMDIIMLSICELAVWLTYHRRGTRDDYTVFGDDVVIRSEAVSAFLGISRSLGFSPNLDKSYYRTDTPSFYREACGIEAYQGEDITPLRYSRFQEPLIARSPVDVTWWESAISLMNRCLVEYYYDNVRSAAWACITYSCSRGKPSDRALSQSIRDHVLRIDYSDFQKGYDGPLAVVVPDGTATNYHCRRYWSNEYQRPYIRVRGLRTVLRDPHSVGWFKHPIGGAAPGPDWVGYAYWFFKAESDRPSAADADILDRRGNRARSGGPTSSMVHLDRLLRRDGVEQHSLLAAAAGIQSQKWGWVRYYP